MPFHPITNSIEYGTLGTLGTQLTQHHVINKGKLNPWYVSPNSSGQITLMFQPNDHDSPPENIEIGMLALLQATVTLNLQAAIPMPKSFYDRNGDEQDHGMRDYPNIYFGLVINTELTLLSKLGIFQVTDTYNPGPPRHSDIGAGSPVAFLMTSDIDPRLMILDNIPRENNRITLAFPFGKYVGPNTGIRMAHCFISSG
jgi:hypothetical protein